jgi:hypothetical protein
LPRFTPGTGEFFIIDEPLLLQTIQNCIGDIFGDATAFEMGEELAPTLCSRRKCD